MSVTVDEKTALADAMLVYKNPAFDETRPLTIKFGNQPALDVGGPKREFFTRVFQELTHDDNSLHLDLFEGPPDRLMPRYSAPLVYSGVFNAVGKMIAHSIVQCGIGFPHLSPPAYWYLITGDVSKAVGYCCIADVKDVQAAAIIERVCDLILVRGPWGRGGGGVWWVHIACGQGPRVVFSIPHFLINCWNPLRVVSMTKDVLTFGKHVSLSWLGIVNVRYITSP